MLFESGTVWCKTVKHMKSVAINDLIRASIKHTEVMQKRLLYDTTYTTSTGCE